MADSKEAPYQPAMRQQIQLFTSADGQAQLQVALEHDTLWLSQAQMGELFDTTPENVLMHLKNIFKDGEWVELATTKDFLVVRQEGARQVRRRIKHYSLDAIISSCSAMQLLQKRQQLPVMEKLPSRALQSRRHDCGGTKELMVRLVEHFVLLRPL